MKTELYDKLVNSFTKDLPEDDKQKFGQAYLKLLHEEYDKYFDMPLSEVEFNDKATFCIKKEKILRLNKSNRDKEAILFPDAAYKELEAISLNIFNLAVEYYSSHNTISDDEYNRIKNKCKELFNQVSQLYRYTAEKIFSESMLELEYIHGTSDNFSFRLSSFVGL